MDIVSTFAPPRLCRLAGETYWVRPLTLEDYAAIVAWLDDVLPGQVGRVMPPLLGSDEASRALASEPGMRLVCWLGLRHLGISYDRACILWDDADIAERARLRRVLLGGRRTAKPTGDGEDIAGAWWGPHVTILAERYHISPAEIGRLTFDQFDCLCGEGLKGEKPDILTIDQVQTMWEAARKEAPDAVAE